MALKPLNSVGGFSVGETPSNVIYPNGDFVGNKANFSGNIAALGLLTDNLYYANGTPWDLQEAAGLTGYIQFNNNNNFAASANFVFDSSNNILTVTGNANVTNTLFTNNANIVANLISGNANLGNLATANFVNVSSNVNVTNTLEAGNVRTDNLLYANGQPWDLQEAAGSNTQIQYNIGNNFAASANFTYNDTTQQFTVLGNGQFNNANLGNLATANFVNVASNVTSNNVTVNLELQANTANFDGNVVMDDWLTVSNTANVGSLRTDNLLYANGQPWDMQEAAGANYEIQYNLGDNFAASANFTYNDTTQQFTVNGGAQFNDANLGNLATANFVNVSNTLNTVDANITGNLIAGNVSLTGDITVPNLTVNLSLTGNTANFSGNVVVPNLTVNLELAGNTANFTGNISAQNAALGNLATANYVNVSQQINGNVANFSGNLTSLNANLGNLATANYVNVANDLTVTGNATAANFIGALANGNSNVKVYANSNVEVTVNGTANVATFTDTEFLVVGEIKTTAGNMLSNGNVTANGFLNGANANVTGEALLGSVKTANIIAPTGNLTISAAGTNENIYLVPSGTGVVDISGKRISQLADPVNPNDAATKEYVDAIAGSGLTIHSPVNVEANSALGGTYAVGGTTQTTTDITGGKTITFSANHGLSVNDGIVWTNSFNGIIGGEAYWVQTVPALNQITIRDGYFGVEVTTLTNGTGLSQASRANPGVGATLTNSGANVALNVDGIAVANGWRVLVYSEANAAHNGIYDVTDSGNSSAAWVLTRSSDMDKYIPASPNGMGKGDYVFVQQGTTGAGESYVLTAPDGEIIIGTDNITFTQFSSAGAYTAGNGISITGTIISANTDGVTTDIVGGNIVVRANAQLTTPNIGAATGTSLNVTGNVDANGLSITNLANVGGNLTVGGNIFANYAVVSNANVSGTNLNASGNVEAGDNVLATNVTANSTVFAANANVSGTTITDALTVNTAISGNTANFSGNIVVNNATVNLELSGNTANFSGNIAALNTNAGNLLTANYVSVSANVVASNLTVNNAINGNTANFTGNIGAANANLGNLVVANYFTGTLVNGTSNAYINGSGGNFLISVGGVADVVEVSASGVDISGNLGVSGNFNVNNLVANTLTANTSVEIGNTDIGWGTVTTSAITANQTIAQFAVAGVTGVEFIVKGVDSSGSKYSVATVTAVTDGSQVDYVTYATAVLGGSTGSLVINITSGNLALQVTPASSNSTVWTAQYRTI